MMDKLDKENRGVAIIKPNKNLSNSIADLTIEISLASGERDYSVKKERVFNARVLHDRIKTLLDQEANNKQRGKQIRWLKKQKKEIDKLDELK
jgi:hypothetical protein